MKKWPLHPVIYEINTWVWLGELSRKYKRPVTLATVPPEEWDQIAPGGFDAVWFMGVWERSPAGIEISMQNQGLLDDFRRALPDFAAEDNVGSPYCVRDYVVDEHLGGPKPSSTRRSPACSNRPRAGITGASHGRCGWPAKRSSRSCQARPGLGNKIPVTGLERKSSTAASPTKVPSAPVSQGANRSNQLTKKKGVH